jgi:hypothetical protein
MKYTVFMNNLAFIREKEKDEYYTPRILVQAILPYIPRDKVVWCPFDTEESEFVRMFRREGIPCVFSHIWDGQDFFTYTPSHFDIVISNPPFTRKLAVLERLYSFNKPFAILLPLPMLNYQEVGAFFLHRDLQLLIPDKKVSFDGNTTSFNTSYFCSLLLPKPLMFTHLDHNNTGKNFTPSAMFSRISEKST